MFDRLLFGSKGFGQSNQINVCGQTNFKEETTSFLMTIIYSLIHHDKKVGTSEIIDVIVNVEASQRACSSQAMSGIQKTQKQCSERQGAPRY